MEWTDSSVKVAEAPDVERLIMHDVGIALAVEVDPDDLDSTRARLEERLADLDRQKRIIDEEFAERTSALAVTRAAEHRQLELQRTGIVSLLDSVRRRMPCRCDVRPNPDCPQPGHAAYAREQGRG